MRKPALLIVSLLVASILAGCTQGEDAPTSSTTTSTTTGAIGPALPTSFPSRPPAQSSPGPWIEGPCIGMPGMGGSSVPDLLALDANKTLTRYTLRENGVEIKGRATPGIALAAALGPMVVTAQQAQGAWRLVLRTPNLVPVQEVVVEPVTAMDSEGGRLFVATQGNLSAYSETLAMLGSVAVGPPGAAGATTLRVKDGYAYLLDSAAAPFRAYRVDARDPAAMRVLYHHELLSSLPPKLQWLDIGNQSWYVERNLNGEGHMVRAVTPLALNNGTPGPDIVFHTSSFPVTAQDPRPQHDVGYLVHDATFQLPAWAIIDANNTLVRIQMRGALIERSCHAPALTDVHVLERDGFVVTWGRTHVRVWTSGPHVVPRADAALPIPPVAMWLAPGLG